MSSPYPQPHAAQPPPGWYPDPAGGPGRRWWDGARWTSYTQHPEPPGSRWRPLRTLALVVAALLVLNVFAQAATALAYGSRISTIARVIDGTATFAEVAGNDDLVALARLVSGLLGVAVAAAFVWWFHAAYGNVRALRRPRYERGWAIWGWIVPIMSFFRPKQILDDLWMAGDAKYDGRHNAGGISPLLHLWWLVWVLANVLAGAGFLLASPAVPQDALGTLRTDAQASLATRTVLALAALLAIPVVLRVTDRMERRHAAAEAERDAAPRATAY